MLPIRIQFKLCDFFNKDPLVGKVIMKQFPKNATCPFGPGWYPIHNITYENNLPFDIPFTFQAIETSICVDLKVNVEDTNERGLHIKIYLQVIQKPRNRKPS
ncbi:uncharacterized protein LOC132902485 [Amyelois transitella]|uniref:uncharacterized protein LOC132902485 n=1 Tax=Amyelois transitella TaxID=680683 RepID=UPI00298F4387|nr:uncharacterized protein LOC132902485 [Amyelois transitella]